MNPNILDQGCRSHQQQEDHDLDAEAGAEILAKYFNGVPLLLIIRSLGAFECMQIMYTCQGRVCQGGSAHGYPGV